MAGYYICNHCGNYMDSNEALVCSPEIHYELDDKPTEWFYELRCIYCNHDEELVDADFCDYCGDIFPVEDLEEGLCPRCYRKYKKGENNDDDEV